MKHYPIMVAGIKATACVELHWNTATVSVKIAHRKGQVVKFDLNNEPKANATINSWVDEYPEYTAIRFEVRTQYFSCGREAISYYASLISGVHKCVNFEANSSLISKELLIILG